MKTTFLFADQSLFSGAARLLDLNGQFDSYNRSRTELEADGRAMYADWVMIGQDIASAMEQLNAETATEKEEEAEAASA